MNYGVVKSPIDIRDYRIKPSSKTVIPATFQLDYIPKVKNQHSVNSCVAHVASSIAEYYEYMQCESKEQLSPGFIYGTRYEYKDEGMYLRDALKTLAKTGICLEKTFPYNEEVPTIISKVNSKVFDEQELNHRRISTYFRLENADEIKEALLKYGPVMISVAWYDDNYTRDGILLKEGKPTGYHCLYVYGWNEEGFLFQNSWGDWWGDDGKAVLPYSYSIMEAFGVSDTNIEDHLVTKKRSKFLDFLYKLLNRLLNMFTK